MPHVEQKAIKAFMKSEVITGIGVSHPVLRPLADSGLDAHMAQAIPKIARLNDWTSSCRSIFYDQTKPGLEGWFDIYDSFSTSLRNAGRHENVLLLKSDHFPIESQKLFRPYTCKKPDCEVSEVLGAMFFTGDEQSCDLPIG